jgi:hypothetical protein
MSVDTGRPISRGDIEAKLRQIQTGTQSGAEAARGAGMIGAAVGVPLIAIAAYLLGRRRGRKRRTIVEIKRV